MAGLFQTLQNLLLRRPLKAVDDADAADARCIGRKRFDIYYWHASRHYSRTDATPKVG